ncbi:MAG: two-component sensor histidine kinase [Archangium sp.]|nr:two-component sensor histidine kinase [Archangium sp.]
MTTWAAVHLLAAASGLVVIALAFGSDPSPLRRPLALLAADQFAWNAASVGMELTHVETFALLGAIAAPLFPPIALHFVLSFLGRRRELKWLLWIAYGVFGAQSLVVLGELLIPFQQVPGGLHTFAILLLAVSVPLALFSLVLVIQHLRRTASDVEALRTRWLLAALMLVVALLVTDPLADLDLPVPRLATLGSFSFNAMLTHLTLGLGLFHTVRSPRVALGQAVVLGLFFAVLYLVVFNSLNAQTSVLVTAMTAISLVLAVFGWLFLKSTQVARTGLERFASLGRFSAQMAHDLKNPLAAAKGAAEYLKEEMRRSGNTANEEFATLVVSQLDRLHTVIDRYQRLSKLEPQLDALDANQLVAKVLSLQRFAVDSNVKIETTLVEPAPKFKGDADLLASALENLVKNGFEAMPKGGTLTVATSITDEDHPRLCFSVTDTGSGLDARAREQAFELFFTTKATGSGLGLAFVRQVARAHGGEATLSSSEGKGTTVSVMVPL